MHRLYIVVNFLFLTKTLDRESKSLKINHKMKILTVAFVFLVDPTRTEGGVAF